MHRFILAIFALIAAAIYLEWRHRKAVQHYMAHACNKSTCTESEQSTGVQSEQAQESYAVTGKRHDMQELSDVDIPEYLEAWCDSADEIGQCNVHGYQNCPQHRRTTNIDPATIPIENRCLGRYGVCDCPVHRQVTVAPTNNCSRADEIGYCSDHGYMRCMKQQLSTSSPPSAVESGVNHGYSYIKRIGSAFVTPVYDD